MKCYLPRPLLCTQTGVESSPECLRSTGVPGAPCDDVDSPDKVAVRSAELPFVQGGPEHTNAVRQAARTPGRQRGRCSKRSVRMMNMRRPCSRCSLKVRRQPSVETSVMKLGSSQNEQKQKHPLSLPPLPSPLECVTDKNHQKTNNETQARAHTQTRCCTCSSGSLRSISEARRQRGSDAPQCRGRRI